MHPAPKSPHFLTSCPSPLPSLWQDNRREYNRRVKEIVEQSWVADEDGGSVSSGAGRSTSSGAAAAGTWLREREACGVRSR